MWQKRVFAFILFALIVLNAAFVNEPTQKRNIVEIPLGNSMANNFTFIPTSYWADPNHLVYCIQTNSVVTYTRHCKVYEYPSGRIWDFPALNSGTSSNGLANDLWNYIGLSKDRKHIFVSVFDTWYITPAISPTSQSTNGQTKWKLFKDLSMPFDYFFSTPYEQARETPPSIPVADRFVGYSPRALSPDGNRTAVIGPNTQPERFHNLRNFLRKFHILSAQPVNGLWISDLSGKRTHCLATFGKTPINSYDLRWSPDGKHISCVSTSLKLSASNPGQAPMEYQLTVFDIPR